MGMEDILKAIPEKVAEKVYDDALSGSMKQLGKFTEDVIKTGRLLLLPIQALGSLQDRVEACIKEINARIPEERRTQAPPEIAGPVIEGLKYLAETNPLKNMFVALLTCAIDKERQSEAHPAFASFISTMSRDEAALVAFVSQQEIEIDQKYDPKSRTKRNPVPLNLSKAEHNVPPDLLLFPERIGVYATRLANLGLVRFYSHPRGKGHAGVLFHIETCGFGRQFARACIPENWREVFRVSQNQKTP